MNYLKYILMKSLNENSCHELYNVVKEMWEGIQETGTDSYVELTKGDLLGKKICAASVKDRRSWIDRVIETTLNFKHKWVQKISMCK